MKTRGTVKVLKHHRTCDVYTNGRYLHVDMKISLKSRRGREIARETAVEILGAVGLEPSSIEEIEIELPDQGEPGDGASLVSQAHPQRDHTIDLPVPDEDIGRDDYAKRESENPANY